ncbi:class I SAM-dependent methyltransferase [Hyphococcus sp.]|uniref:class I SAM-dependent methyltransferase n=1 Tax=Hyphococcus sp. TaxID=2038636 RepID=UPI0035C6DB5D
MTKMQDFIAGRTPPELYEAYLTPGFFTPFAEEMAALAKPGDRCLDLACGTGAVSRKLAERFGERITINAVDIAPPMLEVAKKQSSACSIDYQIAAADDLPFTDDSFDILFCQQGFQFFPDKEKAMAEIRRVLKPGGRAAISVWRPAEEASPVFAAFEKAVGRHLGNDLLPLGPFAFGKAGRLKTLAKGARLKIDALETLTLPTTLPAIEDFVLFDVLFLGRPAADGALQPVLEPEDPDGDRLIALMVEDMTQALQEFVGADGRLHAPSSTHYLLARKTPKGGLLRRLLS